MPRLNIYLSEETKAELNQYVKTTYPGKNATSLVVEEAIKQYLNGKKLIYGRKTA